MGNKEASQNVAANAWKKLRANPSDWCPFFDPSC